VRENWLSLGALIDRTFAREDAAGDDAARGDTGHGPHDDAAARGNSGRHHETQEERR
jgi:hypothetical protein